MNNRQENRSHAQDKDTTPARAQDRGIDEVRTGDSDIHRVVLVRNKLVRYSLKILPWLCIMAIIAQKWMVRFNKAPMSPMYPTGIIAVILILVVFQVLIRQIPLVFSVLWKRSIIGLKGAEVDVSLLPNTPVDVLHYEQKESSEARHQYNSYLISIEDIFNQKLQWLFGLVFVLLVFSWEVDPRFYWDYLSNLIRASFMAVIVDTLFSKLIQFVLAFIIGLLIWRMIILGIYVWKLGRVFNINFRLGDPDLCGGLEPLGDLCLLNALSISIGGVYLGFWIIIGRFPQPSPGDGLHLWWEYAQSYLELYYWLAVVPIILSAVGFFIPLWSIHQSMQTRAKVIRRALDQLIQNVDEMERNLLEKVDILDREQADDLNEKLKLMREVYERNKRIPVWPINFGILVRFASSQIVPVLATIGVSDKISGAIKALFDLITQSSPGA
jgi:hypothetical protein